MNKGARKATRSMRWTKRDGSVVELATGDTFYSFGEDETGKYCLVVIDTTIMFLSSVTSIEDRSVTVEEPEPWDVGSAP